MLEINTIEDFYGLSPDHRTAILKALQTRIRLEDWLRAQGKKPKRHHSKKFWMDCPKCRGESGFWVSPRDGRDVHPSQVTKCMKKIWFDCSTYADEESGEQKPYYLLAEEHIDPQLQMIFDLGHCVHDMMQSYGKRGAWGSKKTYHPEVPLDPDAKGEDGKSILPVAEAFWIRGAVDALLQPYLVNVPGIGDVSIRVIHEYKTINSNGYSKLRQPKSDHKWQATIYSKVLNVPVVVYLYINKDNCQVADFPIPFDHALWNTIEEKITTVLHYVEEHKVIPWELTSAVQDPRECRGCGYNKPCDPPQAGARKR